MEAKDDYTPELNELEMRDERMSQRGLLNIETFKSTASETFFFQRLLGSKIGIINAKREADFEEACAPMEELPELIFLNVLLLISALRIMNRSFSIGTYLAFEAYASVFFLPLSEVLGANDLFRKFEKRLKGLYKEVKRGKEEEAEQRISIEGVSKLAGYVEIKDVCFSYEEGIPVLENINLSIQPGQRVAIIGNSGAGKTTLLKLLQGLYQPSCGEITIDGVNPALLDRRLYSASIGCANQEVTLFAASVRDNITLWDDGVTDAEIYYAATDACIHDHIASLDGAYEYLLSENRNNFSAGQRQRTEIARALLYDPSIILYGRQT